MPNSSSTHSRSSFIFLVCLTCGSLLLITVNRLLGMIISFHPLILLGFVAGLLTYVIWDSVLKKGWKSSLFLFLITFCLTFTAEALGVNFGLIFGRYYYTPALGIQYLGVPFLAALTWEPIIYASFYLVDTILPVSFSPNASWNDRLPTFIGLSLLGAVATTAWDLMVDPIAVSQGWWVWMDGGNYVPYLNNGVPISNYLGWLLVSFTSHMVFRFWAHPQPHHRQDKLAYTLSPIVFYSLLCFSNMGVVLTVLDKPEIALVGFLSMGPFILIAILGRNKDAVIKKEIGLIPNK